MNYLLVPNHITKDENAMKIFIIGISIALGIIAVVVTALMNAKIYPIEIEGSDTSMAVQLQDAGYGSGGVF